MRVRRNSHNNHPYPQGDFCLCRLALSAVFKNVVHHGKPHISD